MLSRLKPAPMGINMSDNRPKTRGKSAEIRSIMAYRAGMADSIADTVPDHSAVERKCRASSEVPVLRGNRKRKARKQVHVSEK